MNADEVRRHITMLTSEIAVERTAARLAFLQLDEDAIQPLADELYSGVSDAAGAAILELMGLIGGWEAMLVLQDIAHAHTTRPHLAQAAERALKDNDLSDRLFDDR